jgi:acetyltransferase-like isoleucine patch superfamily enzyme
MSKENSMTAVTSNDPNFIEFRCTASICDFFNANAIFFDREMSIDPNRRVRVSKHGPIEQYTLFRGGFAHPMGAFSYNYTDTPYLKAGRYCSIGNGLRVFGERHPMEWITTSNITYCFRPEWNKLHFMRAHADLMGNQWAPMNPTYWKRPYADNPVLEHDVWVSEMVTLARDITIGTGAVLGAGAVVTKSVPPYMIVAGNPARPIRQRFPDQTCERLLASRWWELHPNALFSLDARDPEAFLDRVEAARETVGPCPVRGFTWEDVLGEIGC